MAASGRHRSSGFTLPELLAVLAITGILVAIALPGFASLIANQRARSISADLMTALARARSEAVKRNTDISLSPSANGWAGGWSIMHPTDSSITLDTHGPINDSTITGPAEVVFQANGRGRANSNLTFDVMPEHATAHRCIGIDLSGRPKQTIQDTAC